MRYDIFHVAADLKKHEPLLLRLLLVESRKSFGWYTSVGSNHDASNFDIRRVFQTPLQSTKMSSSTNKPPASSSTSAQPAEKSFFEQQREILLKEIGVVSCAHVEDK